MGPRPAGLAHRVLGDGRGGCWASSFDIHGGGIDLVFPHHENEAAQTLAGRGRPLARDLDAQRDARDRPTREDVQVGGQHPRRWPTCSTSTGPRRCSSTSAPATTASRSRSRPSACRTRRRAARADPRRRAPARARRLAAGAGARTARRSSTRWPTTSTPPRALAALYDWVRDGQPVATSRRATPTCARCSASWASSPCWRPSEGPPEEVASSPRSGEARASGADWAEADRLRDELRALGWEVRDGPEGPELVAACLSRHAGSRRGGERMVVYGRNPVREALRGRRRVHRVWATQPPRGRAGPPAPVSVAPAEEIARRAARTPTRASAREVDPYPYADAAELLAAPDAAAGRARRGAPTRRTSARSAARRSARARRAW